nr:hypothetical protein [Tanacetum cinerariifolium]
MNKKSHHSASKVTDAPTLSVNAEKNLGDPIEIRVDIVHPAPADVFPVATVVRTLAQHEEAIRGIHGHLQGVPINEEMNALRFRMGMAEEENASNCKKIGHLTKDCWHPINANNQRTITCYECGNQGHYKSDCPVLKNQGTEARGRVYALGGGETNQDLDNAGDDINA